jgi:hypothetical protein
MYKRKTTKSGCNEAKVITCKFAGKAYKKENSCKTCICIKKNLYTFIYRSGLVQLKALKKEYLLVGFACYNVNFSFVSFCSKKEHRT